MSLLADGHVRAARVAHADGQFDDARHHYVAAMDNAPRNLLAILGVAQMQVQNGIHSPTVSSYLYAHGKRQMRYWRRFTRLMLWSPKAKMMRVASNA